MRASPTPHVRAAAWVVSAALVGFFPSCRGRKPAEGAASATPSIPAVQPLPDEAYRVEWVANTVPPIMKPGASATVTVTIKNVSAVSWPGPNSSGSGPSGAGAVRLGQRWWSPTAPIPIGEAPTRADLEHGLGPGESATLQVVVTAPTSPGEYQLEFDLIQELVAWFGRKGAATALVPVRVE
jgi:hypothetical protein